LASIGAHGHLDASIEQTTKTDIGEGFDTLINEVQIDFYPLPDGGFGEPDNGLNTPVRWGCG
jgi:hypothetical protein